MHKKYIRKETHHAKQRVLKRPGAASLASAQFRHMLGTGWASMNGRKVHFGGGTMISCYFVLQFANGEHSVPKTYNILEDAGGPRKITKEDNSLKPKVSMQFRPAGCPEIFTLNPESSRNRNKACPESILPPKHTISLRTPEALAKSRS
jgi:hypothetical protein